MSISATQREPLRTLIQLALLFPGTHPQRFIFNEIQNRILSGCGVRLTSQHVRALPKGNWVQKTGKHTWNSFCFLAQLLLLLRKIKALSGTNRGRPSGLKQRYTLYTCIRDMLVQTWAEVPAILVVYFRPSRSMTGKCFERPRQDQSKYLPAEHPRCITSIEPKIQQVKTSSKL
jgi:hypothetical protein